MTNVVKNRYIQLDGTPVESGAWRRFVTPLSLATTLAASIVTCALPEEKTKMSPWEVFSCAAMGIGLSGQRRRDRMENYAKIGLDNYVIDTKPTTEKHSCTQGEFNEIKTTTEAGILASPAASILTAGFFLKIYPLYTGLATVIPILPANLACAYEQTALRNNIIKNKWIIVARGEMQEQEESAPETPTLSAQPT